VLCGDGNDRGSRGGGVKGAEGSKDAGGCLRGREIALWRETGSKGSLPGWRSGTSTPVHESPMREGRHAAVKPLIDGRKALGTG